MRESLELEMRRSTRSGAAVRLPAAAVVLLAALSAGALASTFVACSPPPVPPSTGADPGPGVTASPLPTEGPSDPAAPTASPPSTGDPAAPSPILACRLPEPRKSEDACKTDADCGVSDPCHAHACVAKAKARQPDPQTICTQIMDCHSADRNPCACYEGVCALIPPAE